MGKKVKAEVSVDYSPGLLLSLTLITQGHRSSLAVEAEQFSMDLPLIVSMGDLETLLTRAENRPCKAII